MTKYRVLKSGTDGYEGVGIFEARDPKDAASQAVTGADDPASAAQETYVVVPESAWTVLKPTGVEVQTKVSFA